MLKANRKKKMGVSVPARKRSAVFVGVGQTSENLHQGDVRQVLPFRLLEPWAGSGTGWPEP